LFVVPQFLSAIQHRSGLPSLRSMERLDEQFVTGDGGLQNRDVALGFAGCLVAENNVIWPLGFANDKALLQGRREQHKALCSHICMPFTDMEQAVPRQEHNRRMHSKNAGKRGVQAADFNWVFYAK